MATGDKTGSGLSVGETRSSLSAYNLSGGLRSVFDNISATTTFVYVAFALALGLPKEKMGFIGAAVGVASLAQIATLFIVDCAKNRKAYVITLAVLEPMVVLCTVLLAPYVPPVWRIVLIISAAFVSAAMVQMTSPFVAEWIAATVPSRLRGRFLGRRVQIQQAFTVVAALAAGFVLEKMGRTNTVGISCILATGAVFGLLSVIVLKRAIPPAESLTTGVGWASITGALKNALFLRYMLACLVVQIPFYFACPYYQVFNLEIVHMRAMHIAYLTVVYTICKIVSLPAVGRICDRGGMKTVIVGTMIAYVLFFAAFPFAAPGRSWHLFLAWGLAGLADGAFSVWTGMLLYGIVPLSRSRPAVFAIFNLVSTGPLGLGALFAVPILAALKNVHLQFAGIELTQFHVFYLLVLVMMVLCSFSARIFFSVKAAAGR